MFLQAGLWGALTPVCDATFRGAILTDLGHGSWVEFVPGWLEGSDDLFTELSSGVRWQQRTALPMYDRLVDEPRLTWHGGRTDVAAPPVEADMWAALSSRYSEPFDLLGMNLYRNGADSVAWHRDRNRLGSTDPVVAIVSLGARRPFRLRPHGRSGGRPCHSWELGQGDLLVMGGSCQHDWEHTVPKASRPVGPRLSIMYRSSVDARRRATRPTTELPPRRG